MQQRMLWRGLAIGVGVGAGIASRSAMNAAWRRVQGSEPPANPASPRTSWPEALTWSIALGVAVAVARVVAQRGAAEAWRATTGAYPETLDETA